MGPRGEKEKEREKTIWDGLPGEKGRPAGLEREKGDGPMPLELFLSAFYSFKEMTAGEKGKTNRK